MKRFYIGTFVIVGSLVLSSCSYSDIDNALDEKIHNNPAPEATINDGNGNVDSNSNVNENGIIYIEENGIFPDYYTFTYSSDNSVFEDGIKGLSFKFNKATVYDTINDSPIKTDECGMGFDLLSSENINNGILENNFVLVDMTAYYEKEDETQPDAIQFFMCMDVTYKGGENFKEFQPSTFQNGQATDDYSSINPIIQYFSEQPKKGDKDLSGNEIDLIHNSNMCRTPLKNGESLDFQLGIIVSEKLTEDKNLFLINRLSDVPEDSDSPIYYVDLIGRFINEENANN